MIVPLNHILILAGILFASGAWCAVARKNLIMILLGVEIMLNASGIAFAGAALRWGRLDGQVFIIFILAVAASEVAVGLALFIYSQRRTETLDADSYKELKW